MFEVLVYLFENYMDGSVALNADADTIYSELEQAGFTRGEIGRALDWLEGLAKMQSDEAPLTSDQSVAMRIYSPDELTHLSTAERGFILYLEQLRIIDATTREVVIDRLLALDKNELGVSRIKWVVLLALFNQPEKKAALSLLQEMIVSEAFETLH